MANKTEETADSLEAVARKIQLAANNIFAIAQLMREKGPASITVNGVNGLRTDTMKRLQGTVSSIQRAYSLDEPSGSPVVADAAKAKRKAAARRKKKE